MSRFYDFNALELMEMAPISIFSRNKNTEIFLDDQLLEQERRHCLSVHIFCRKLERFEEEFNSNKVPEIAWLSSLNHKNAILSMI
jgi:hypothetical protein